MIRMSHNPKTITIFEGPDGSGKTTLAKAYAEAAGALYVHFEAYYAVNDIHKYFIEAMQPALMGYQDVVLDRCWHSGPIYDMFFRNLDVSEQRQTPEICLLLDRAAKHCGAVIVNCRPSEDTCINNWGSRIDSELVKSEMKMRGIYRSYRDIQNMTILPTVEFNYTNDSLDYLVSEIKVKRTINKRNSGRFKPVNIVVSSGSKTNADVMIDIPGVRFDKSSNEFKLAEEFAFDYNNRRQEVPTDELVRFLPIDTNFDEFLSNSSGPLTIITIGDEATSSVNTAVLNLIGEIESRKRSASVNVGVINLYDVIADRKIREVGNLGPLKEMILKEFNQLNGIGSAGVDG